MCELLLLWFASGLTIGLIALAANTTVKGNMHGWHEVVVFLLICAAVGQALVAGAAVLAVVLGLWDLVRRFMPQPRPEPTTPDALRRLLGGGTDGCVAFDQQGCWRERVRA